MERLDKNHFKNSPLMVGISGYQLTKYERDYLTNSRVGGVILFSRNYQDRQQLTALTNEIHALNPKLMIAVDQEGGRVQRFRYQFTSLPAAYEIGRCYDQNKMAGLALATDTAVTLATELQAVGIDLSFAPVLDLYDANSKVIGDRAFHHDPHIVAKLAVAFIDGLRSVGFPAIGKHYPGHGSVIADTHIDQVIDDRSLAQIEQQDLVPFKRCIEYGISGIMSSHVIYSQVDSRPASYSKIWLDKLRQDYSFTGIIFSDDLGMQAAKSEYGHLANRAQQALSAGCDVVLLCNALDQIAEVIETITIPKN